MRYFWSDSELGPMDYSVGLARLDADIAAVKKAGKKLLVFLNYEKSDGTPCVPADLLTGPGPWCSGANGEFCGQMPNGTAPYPIYWNDAVAARMRGWLQAMASHIQASPDRDVVAGITLPEASLRCPVSISWLIKTRTVALAPDIWARILIGSAMLVLLIQSNLFQRGKGSI